MFASSYSTFAANTMTILIILLFAIVNADYWSERASLIQSDVDHSVGAKIKLTPKEQQVNKILMGFKEAEYDAGFNDPSVFLAAGHFFKTKKKIDQSEVYNIIRQLPKGASLHSHDTALVSFEYLYNLTYRDDLYGCMVDGRLLLRFFGDTTNGDCAWELVKTLRDNDPTFDDFLKTQISILVDDPQTEYPSITEVWKRFMQTFGTIDGLVCYRPVFQNYFYQALKELYEDNVMYLEFRGLLPQVYELNGTVYDPERVTQLYVQTLDRFLQDYPDFHGARFIFAPSRNVDNSTADDYITTIKKLKARYPDFIAGFDLVGQEDKGKPLIDFIPQLLDMGNSGIKFFFHAAETNWDGTSTDLNLFDAVLLNTTRIGHGYGIVKHPKILEEVKTRKIAIEINPISNQVLKLVDDLRNHPAAYLINSGYPVVITCDDPSFWDARALSYDWYMAYMGFASRESDLRLLKQLAINSLVYSAMDNNERNHVLTQWETLWDQFLDKILQKQSFRKYYSKISNHIVTQV